MIAGDRQHDAVNWNLFPLLQTFQNHVEALRLVCDYSTERTVDSFFLKYPLPNGCVHLRMYIFHVVLKNWIAPACRELLELCFIAFACWLVEQLSEISREALGFCRFDIVMVALVTGTLEDVVPAAKTCCLWEVFLDRICNSLFLICHNWKGLSSES